MLSSCELAPDSCILVSSPNTLLTWCVSVLRRGLSKEEEEEEEEEQTFVTYDRLAVVIGEGA